MPNPGGENPDGRPPITGDVPEVGAQVKAIFEEPQNKGAVVAMEATPDPSRPSFTVDRIQPHEDDDPTPGLADVHGMARDAMNDLSAEIPPLFPAPSTAEAPASPDKPRDERPPYVPPPIDPKMPVPRGANPELEAAVRDALSPVTDAHEAARQEIDEQIGLAASEAARRIVNPDAASAEALLTGALTERPGAVHRLGDAVDRATGLTATPDGPEDAAHIMGAREQQERNESGQGLTPAQAERAMQGLPVNQPESGQPPQPGEQQ